MNRKLLLKVADAIEANPKHFNMGGWIDTGRCGTTACIAGWAYCLSENKPLPDEQAESQFYRANTKEILGLTWQQWRTLVYEELWLREDLSADYSNTGIPEKRAKAAAEYVRWFVENVSE